MQMLNRELELIASKSTLDESLVVVDPDLRRVILYDMLVNLEMIRSGLYFTKAFERFLLFDEHSGEVYAFHKRKYEYSFTENRFLVFNKRGQEIFHYVDQYNFSGKGFIKYGRSGKGKYPTVNVVCGLGYRGSVRLHSIIGLCNFGSLTIFSVGDERHFDIHHDIPVARCGSNSSSNLVLLPCKVHDEIHE